MTNEEREVLAEKARRMAGAALLTAERERDTLAAALAQTHGALAAVLVKVREMAVAEPLGHLRDVVARADEALDAAPADLAAKRDGRVRAEALREARDAIEMAFGHDEDVSAQDVIDRLLADEAEKGGA